MTAFDFAAAASAAGLALLAVPCPRPDSADHDDPRRAGAARGGQGQHHSALPRQRTGEGIS